jgi:hypothetical protein
MRPTIRPGPGNTLIVNDADLRPQFIVGEVSKNWPDPGAPPGFVNKLFEDMINANYERGYELHSFQLNRFALEYAEPNNMNETIIAVFKRREA